MGDSGDLLRLDGFDAGLNFQTGEEVSQAGRLLAELFPLLILAVWIGVRTWRSGMALTVKWGVLVLLTVLASPHLLTYDLILLTIPLLVFADWAITHRDHRLQPWIARLLVFLYLAPFSSNLVRLLPLQLSVVVMVLLVILVVAATRTAVRSP